MQFQHYVLQYGQAGAILLDSKILATDLASSLLAERTPWSTTKARKERLYGLPVTFCSLEHRVASAIESTPPLMARPTYGHYAALV